ncbi:MAG TPA: RNB domain-containing ribonuclease [Acidisarcina sp.]
MNPHPPFDLQAAARQSMLDHGFNPDFPADALQQAASLAQQPPAATAAGLQDLRQLLWSSIDNDTSRDLDQIEWAERLPGGPGRVLIGIADVDAFVPQDSPIDRYAASETTTVYTGVHNYSMLPESLSTGATSLLEDQDRVAFIIEFTVDKDGHVAGNKLYSALVRNRAQLAYDSVGAWLEGRGEAPPKVAASADLQAQLKLQDELAQALRQARYRHGALNIETIETHPLLVAGQIVDVVNQQKNHATELIEDFMIAANQVVASSLEAARLSSLRRVVKTPKRWDRIVALAAQQGGSLPATPDSAALNDFLNTRKAADPDHFADLSLAVVKLMGPGEYVVQRPGDPPQGHFGLAVQDYTHSTAPNRRFADLLTQRLLKAAGADRATTYSDDQLNAAAQNCTLKEDAARKVEREMQKRIAAVAMSSRIGQTFDAMVTGVNEHGTFVRTLQPHVEGMLVRGQQGIDVGDRLRVTLVRADAQRGFIDFARADNGGLHGPNNQQGNQPGNQSGNQPGSQPGKLPVSQPPSAPAGSRTPT